MRSVAAAAVLLCLPHLAAARDVAALPEARLQYGVSYDGTYLGEAELTLTEFGERGCYRYESHTRPVGIVRMFYGSPSEVSDFCVTQGNVVPRRFEYRNSKDKKSSYWLEFDHVARVVRSNRSEPRSIPADAQDRLGIHQAVRLWLMRHAGKADPQPVEFTLVEEERMRSYRFAITGRTSLQTEGGRFDTVVVERINDPRKITRLWVAPALQYMPVRVERVRNGKVEFRMDLRAVAPQR